jgi:hypothetical protein
VAKVKYDKKSIEYFHFNSNSNTSSRDGKEEKESKDGKDELEDNFDDSSDDGGNVLNCMNKIITLNYNDNDLYNEYRFGHIKISKQTDFLNYFWLAI